MSKRDVQLTTYNLQLTTCRLCAAAIQHLQQQQLYRSVINYIIITYVDNARACNKLHNALLVLRCAAAVSVVEGEQVSRK
jgi:hypothetical protein